MPENRLIPELSNEDIIRFLQKTDCRAGDCWLWLASKIKKGYGRFTIKGHPYGAHRISYRIFRGEIPQNMLVCHSCDNPSCVNPNHLWLGTMLDNIHDMERKGRQKYPPGSEKRARGEKHCRAILTDTQVAEVRTLYATGNYTQRQIADMYSAKSPSINKIIKGRTRK